jgi:hypothetical protein
MQDGVEVVLNHLEPYKLKGEPANLIFEEEYTIDTEREEILKVGLVNIETFNVDSEGNVYFVNDPQSTGNIILKFDRDGNFVASFGRKGQGPGEIQSVLDCSIDSKDSIIVSDYENRKILSFNNSGRLIKETRYGSNTHEAFPLENGKYIEIRRMTDLSVETFPVKLVLCDADFEELKELDVFIHPNPLKGNKRPYRVELFIGKVVKNKIYIGNEQRGYEILVYDLEGNLLRKIKKDYKPLLLPEEFKKELEPIFLKPRTKQFFYIPKDMPPFNSFFIDNEEKLYVMTYEKSNNDGEYIHDIFNSDGVFVTRKSIKNYGKLFYNLLPLRVVAKKNRLYCLQEKESGFKELVVYKMRWE